MARNLRPMEDEKGGAISPDECTRIRSLARALFNQIAIKNPRCLPKSWSYAGLELEREAISELSRQFPKFQLCSGDWKTKHFLSEFYSDWSKSHRKTVPGIKEEEIRASESEHANVPHKRKPNITGSPRTKKAQFMSSSSDPVDNVESLKSDTRSSHGEHQSGSEASKLRVRPKDYRKVHNPL